LNRPRLEPLAISEVDSEVRKRFGDGKILNIFRTLAHHPDLMKRWLVFGNHILGKSTLTARDRELLILRVGWLCQAEYEWAQHAEIALQSNLDQEEIDRVTKGPEALGWSELEIALLRAADELVADAFITDDTWKALTAFYNTKQMMDLVFTVGQYNLVSMALNSLGVQIEDGVAGFPKSKTDE
ncbi:MAG: carboxymuconolactone decarboxylase family protein, partial [Myxococcota bacterium]